MKSKNASARVSLFANFILLASCAGGENTKTKLQSSQEFEELFEQHYWHSYEAGYCGKNSLAFINKSHDKFGNAQELYLISLVNKGFSMFGMVNAEKARSVIQGNNVADESNWHHHAFVVDKNGFVYDFDYESQPTQIHFTEYIDKMYLEESECFTPVYGEFCIGKEDKLDDYKITVLPGLSAVEKSEVGKKEFKLNEVYVDWKKLVQNY